MDEAEGFWADALAALDASIEESQRQWAAKTLLAYPYKDHLVEIAEDLRTELASNVVEVNTITTHEQVTIAKVPVSPFLPGQVPLDNSLCVYAVGMDRPLAVADIQGSEFTKGHVAQKWVKSWAAVPIRIANSPAGAICALEITEKRAWTIEDQASIERAATRIEDAVASWVDTQDRSVI